MSAPASAYIDGVCDGLNQAAAMVQGWGLGSASTAQKMAALYLVLQIQAQAADLRRAARSAGADAKAGAA